MGWRDYLPTYGERAPYNGPLSTYAEWHALGHGLYDGLRSARPRPKRLPDNQDIQKEPHMYKVGFLLSTVAQGWFLLAVLALAAGVANGVFS